MTNTKNTEKRCPTKDDKVVRDAAQQRVYGALWRHGSQLTMELDAARSNTIMTITQHKPTK